MNEVFHLPPHGVFANNLLDPAYPSGDLEEMVQWKNLNSFVARLTSGDFEFGITLPVWQLRFALEEPAVKGPAMECRLWVATGWISRCAGILYGFMTSGTELDDDTARAFRTHELCEDIAPWGLGRWEFWKKRFSELAADVEGLEVDGAIVARITGALESMEAAEK